MLDFMNQGQVTLKDVEKSIKDLPLPQKIKAIAIYKRYKQIRAIEEEMQKAIREVEKKYLKLDEPVLTNISDLIQGKRNIQQAQLKDLDKYLTEDQKKEANNHLQIKKIPDYWEKCLVASPVIKDNVGTEDSTLLKSLENIHVVDEEGTDNFTIIFTFGENEVIKNKELTKKFYINDKSEPTKCQASTIEWVSKNLTLKQVKKKQKNKKTGQQRVITKQVRAKSFFNFFRSIDSSNFNELQATEEQMTQREELEQDFEIGGIIVDEVLPYSLQYYLGVEHQGDDEVGLGDDDEQNEDSDDDGDKKHKKSKSKSKSKGKDKKADGKPEEKPQCKQQ